MRLEQAETSYGQVMWCWMPSIHEEHVKKRGLCQDVRRVWMCWALLDVLNDAIGTYLMQRALASRQPA